MLGKLEIRGSGFDAHLLCFVAACYYAPIVVREDNNRLAVEIRAEYAFAAHIAVIAVNDAVHRFLFDP